MDTIQIANILLTRRCNLRCDYCSIVRDYSNMPDCYPRMSYYKENELSVGEWMAIIDRLVLNNPDIFLIFYGGEPFLYDGLTELVKYCHDQHIGYTIISNNTEEIQPKIIQLYKDVGQIHGFSASIDPSLFIPNAHERDHAVVKTRAGFDNLCKIKECGMARDVVAEITITAENAQYLFNTVKALSENGIYSSITTLDLKKSDYYDFSTIVDQSLLIEKTPMIAKQFMDIMSDDSLLVHIPRLLVDLYKILPTHMKCQIADDVHNVSIDADGSFRLCLRIRGKELQYMKPSEVIREDGTISHEAKWAMKQDYHMYCKGCNHTCLLMSKYYSKGITEH